MPRSHITWAHKTFNTTHTVPLKNRPAEAKHGSILWEGYKKLMSLKDIRTGYWKEWVPQISAEVFWPERKEL